MTLSRFLRDFLYIPLGGNRRGRLLHLPQPDDHDGARRALARRGVDVRALGRASTAPGCASSTRSAAGWERVPAWLRWFVTFHLVVFGWILFRSHRACDSSATFIARLFAPGPGDAVDASRSCWRSSS